MMMDVLITTARGRFYGQGAGGKEGKGEWLLLLALDDGDGGFCKWHALKTLYHRLLDPRARRPDKLISPLYYFFPWLPRVFL